MRDKIKSLNYFNDFIEDLYRSQEKRYNKLKNNEIKSNRLPPVKRDMYKNYLKIIFAKYSRGDDMFSDKVKNDFHTALILLDESWSKNHTSVVSSQERKGEFLKQYSQPIFNYFLDFLSLGVLLNIDFHLLVNFIDRDEVKDFLFEFLIFYRSKERRTIKEESYSEYFGINEKYGKLKEVLKANSKDEAQEKIKSFLEEDWYNSFKGSFVYGLHTSGQNTYCGYWCFASAAIVKIMDLDDSSFRDNEYYPKDLV